MFSKIPAIVNTLADEATNGEIDIHEIRDCKPGVLEAGHPPLHLPTEARFDLLRLE